MDEFFNVRVFRNKSNNQIMFSPSKKELKSKGFRDVLDAKNGSSIKMRFVK